jgi:hypothetical protein
MKDLSNTSQAYVNESSKNVLQIGPRNTFRILILANTPLDLQLDSIIPQFSIFALKMLLNCLSQYKAKCVD